jgi:lipopolysaccharide export system protein LptC
MTREADLLRDRRRHFALPGGSHDRLVRWLAIALPAGIGAVLAIMVIAPLFPRGEISFLLDRNKVATTEERLRVNNALYRGEDTRGRPFSLTASSAVQQSGKVPVVDMNDLSAKILLKDGPAELQAGNGKFDIDRNVVTVPGAIDFRSADGYRLSTSNIAVDLKQQTFAGTGGVSGAVPSGTFQAGRMDVDLENRTIVLSGRAKLQMRPGKIPAP